MPGRVGGRRRRGSRSRSPLLPDAASRAGGRPPSGTRAGRRAPGGSDASTSSRKPEARPSSGAPANGISDGFVETATQAPGARRERGLGEIRGRRPPRADAAAARSSSARPSRPVAPLAVEPARRPRGGARSPDCAPALRAKRCRTRARGTKRSAKPCRADAVLPLGLLVLEEEALVEAADAVEDVAARGQHRADQVRRVAARAPRAPACAARRPREARPDAELAEESRGRQLGRQAQRLSGVPEAQRRRGPDRRILDRREQRRQRARAGRRRRRCERISRGARARARPALTPPE